MLCFLLLCATNDLWDIYRDLDNSLKHRFAAPDTNDGIRVSTMLSPNGYTITRETALQLVGQNSDGTDIARYTPEHPTSRTAKGWHVVTHVGNFYSKRLVTDGSVQEYPGNTFLAHALAHVLNIPNTPIAPSTLVCIHNLHGQSYWLQVSPEVGMKDLEASDTINPESFSWQFMLTLLLRMGDAKSDNYRLDEQGHVIAIDTEDISRLLSKLINPTPSYKFPLSN